MGLNLSALFARNTKLRAALSPLASFPHKPPTKSDRGWGRGGTNTRHIAVAALTLLGVCLVMFPFPTWAIDVMFVGSLTMGLWLLLHAMLGASPRTCAALPRVLLLGTASRVVLGVAAARLILLHGEAGRMIDAAGHLATSDNLWVGIALFLLLAMVQMVVVAKGAERLAEVRARFALDGLPVRQMSIDAQVRSGETSAATARGDRRLLQEETHFLGAMDGAMKFVHGDAIAAMVVLSLTFAGGLLRGVGARGADELASDGLMVIGSALLWQIPALCMSLGAALIATRSVDAENDAENDAETNRPRHGGLCNQPVKSELRGTGLPATGPRRWGFAVPVPGPHRREDHPTPWYHPSRFLSGAGANRDHIVRLFLFGFLAASALVPGLPMFPFAFVAVALAFVHMWRTAEGQRIDPGQEPRACRLSLSVPATETAFAERSEHSDRQDPGHAHPARAIDRPQDAASVAWAASHRQAFAQASEALGFPWIQVHIDVHAPEDPRWHVTDQHGQTRFILPPQASAPLRSHDPEAVALLVREAAGSLTGNDVQRMRALLDSSDAEDSYAHVVPRLMPAVHWLHLWRMLAREGVPARLMPAVLDALASGHIANATKKEGAPPSLRWLAETLRPSTIDALLAPCLLSHGLPAWLLTPDTEEWIEEHIERDPTGLPHLALPSFSGAELLQAFAVVTQQDQDATPGHNTPEDGVATDTRGALPGALSGKLPGALSDSGTDSPPPRAEEAASATWIPVLTSTALRLPLARFLETRPRVRVFALDEIPAGVNVLLRGQIDMGAHHGAL